MAFREAEKASQDAEMEEETLGNFRGRLWFAREKEFKESKASSVAPATFANQEYAWNHPELMSSERTERREVDAVFVKEKKERKKSNSEQKVFGGKSAFAGSSEKDEFDDDVEPEVNAKRKKKKKRSKKEEEKDLTLELLELETSELQEKKRKKKKRKSRKSLPDEEEELAVEELEKDASEDSQAAPVEKKKKKKKAKKKSQQEDMYDPLDVSPDLVKEDNVGSRRRPGRETSPHIEGTASVGRRRLASKLLDMAGYEVDEDEKLKDEAAANDRQMSLSPSPIPTKKRKKKKRARHPSQESPRKRSRHDRYESEEEFVDPRVHLSDYRFEAAPEDKIILEDPRASVPRDSETKERGRGEQRARNPRMTKDSSSSRSKSPRHNRDDRRYPDDDAEKQRPRMGDLREDLNRKKKFSASISSGGPRTPSSPPREHGVEEDRRHHGPRTPSPRKNRRGGVDDDERTMARRSPPFIKTPHEDIRVDDDGHVRNLQGAR